MSFPSPPRNPSARDVESAVAVRTELSRLGKAASADEDGSKIETPASSRTRVDVALASLLTSRFDPKY